jgi:ABC-type uncharacterized transport system permease subunit
MLACISAGFAVAAYLTAAVLLAVRLVRRTASPLAVDRMRGTALGFGLAGTAAHAISLATLIVQADGLDLAIANIVSLVGWVIALVILLTALRQRVLNLAIPLLPLSALSAFAGIALTATPVLIDQPRPILVTHILLSIAAYSLLSVAALLALVLAFQEQRLHGRQPGGILRVLPPLEITERLLFQLIGLGFAGLTLALFSGMVFVENLFAQHLVHKTVLSTLAWLLFGVLLWGRWNFGWRGRIAIRWTLAAFVLLALAYFGSRIVLESVLGARWG